MNSDLENISKQFEKIVFWEKDKSELQLNDEEWLKQEKFRELQMKKLMTVSKSKYYMLKINYAKIFEEVDFEEADGNVDVQPDNVNSAINIFDGA